MKKYILCLLPFFLVLMACSSQASDQSKESKAATTSQELVRTTEVTTEAVVEETEKVEVYQYEVVEENVKQIVKEILNYKGDKFLKMELHITQEADEATKANFAGFDFATVKTELLAYLEEQNFTKQLRAVPGLELATDVSPDYSIIMHIKIDMATIDLQALSNVEGVGADFTDLDSVTPSAYILGLKLRGAVKVSE